MHKTLKANDPIGIIGAGAAGLSAAYELRKQGYQNITVLEKLPQIGGHCRTIQIGDRNYEIGALVVGVPYTSIQELIRETGASTAPLQTLRTVELSDSGYRVMPRLRQVFSKLRPIWKSVSIYREKYANLGQPGYRNLPWDELGCTFEQWARKRNLTEILSTYASIYVGWGYGYLENVAAAYVFKLADLYYKSINDLILHPTRGAAMEYLVDGYQNLWQRVARPFDVRTNVTVQSITRGEDIRVRTDSGEFVFQKLILACPLDESLKFLDASPDEKRLLSRIRNLDFYTFACTVENPDSGHFYFVNENLAENRRGHVISSYRRWLDRDICVYYVIGDGSSQEELFSRLEKDVAGAGGRITELHRADRWKYFPHVSPEDIRLGFYDEMERMQGRNSTYYAGGILGFPTVETVSQYSRDLARRHFSENPDTENLSAGKPVVENNKKLYRSLRRHLNSMPVGYPATLSGVEMRLLRRIFTPAHAEAALLLTHRFETPQEILERTKPAGYTAESLRVILEEMTAKGAIFYKNRAGVDSYALVPFIVGMYELQAASMSPELYRDTMRYFVEGYALEWLGTSIPQMRVIPIGRSINHRHRVSTYDEIRAIVERADERIGIVECICRTGQDLIGEPCKRTRRREVCMGFADMYDTFKKIGKIRQLTKEEALQILDRSEREGLVLQPSNEKDPQFVCACCGCCCGVLRTLQHVPRLADFVASNYYAQVTAHQCDGCTACRKRCHVGAITMSGTGDETHAFVDRARCIGCGTCVPVCRTEAIQMYAKPVATIPPDSTEELYETILKKKQGVLGRIKTGVRIITRSKS